MATVDTTWYVNFGNGSSTGHYAVLVRPQNTSVAAGIVRRQFTTPAVGSERCFVCIVGGTTANTTDATWTVTRGAKTTDGTATWQECTGASAVNGDLTNTPNWTTVKNTSVTLGQIIQRNNGVSYQICSTAGTAGNSSEPSFSDTAGTTTADNTITWTSLGAVGNFTGGSTPHARLGNACANSWCISGNSIYIADNSAETQTASLAITFGTNVGTYASPVKVLSYDHTKGNYPVLTGDLLAGATVAVSGGNINMQLQPNVWYVYGVTFKSGTSGGLSTMNIGNGANTLLQVYDTCSFWNQDSAGSAIGIGSGVNTAPSACEFRNTTIKFAATAGFIKLFFTQFTWRNTGQVLVSGSSVPTNFLEVGVSTAGNFNTVLIEACDLSQLTGNILAWGSNGIPVIGQYTLKDCKLNASATLATSTVLYQYGNFLDAIRCDSSGIVQNTRYRYQGSEVTELTVVRTGGAQDAGTSVARKIVTLAASTGLAWITPYDALPFAIWNDTTGSTVNVTVYGIWGGGAVPNNDDIWMDVEYPSDSGSPLGAYLSGTKSNVLATGSALSSDGSTWGGSTTAFKMTAAITPQKKGLIYCYIKAAKASTTFYVDPQPVLS